MQQQEAEPLPPPKTLGEFASRLEDMRRGWHALDAANEQQDAMTVVLDAICGNLRLVMDSAPGRVVGEFEQSIEPFDTEPWSSTHHDNLRAAVERELKR